MKRAAIVLCALFVPLIVHADSSRTRQASIRRLLVSAPGDGVYLYDLKGTELWSFRCDPYDATELTGGEILVTERMKGRVFIVTRDKQITWERAGLQGPVNAEPLDHGGVLVLENVTGSAIEFAGDMARRSYDGHVTPFDARRRPNGNVVVADSGNNRIVEYSLEGKLLRATPGLKFPNSLFLLPGGRTLFTTYTNGTFGELDDAGALAWERKIGGVLYSIVPEGNAYWISDGNESRVLQVTREGAVVRQIKVPKRFVDVAFCR
jgi:hypothetical protein